MTLMTPPRRQTSSKKLQRHRTAAQRISRQRKYFYWTRTDTELQKQKQPLGGSWPWPRGTVGPKQCNKIADLTYEVPSRRQDVNKLAAAKLGPLSGPETGSQNPKPNCWASTFQTPKYNQKAASKQRPLFPETTSRNNNKPITPR